MASKQLNPIYKFFTPNPNNKDQATCNTCTKKYTCTGGTTTSLINHLKTQHKETFKDYEKLKSPNANAKRSGEELKPKAKQAKLEDCVPKSDKDLNEAIDDAIVDFLADSGVAFQVVGLESFKNLMKVANRRIKLKHRTTYSKLVKVKGEQIRKEIMSIITAVKGDLTTVGFTTDMWTSCSGDPFMSLTCHFIDKDWELHRCALLPPPSSLQVDSLCGPLPCQAHWEEYCPGTGRHAGGPAAGQRGLGAVRCQRQCRQRQAWGEDEQAPEAVPLLNPHLGT
jgi:hypothetical protein